MIRVLVIFQSLYWIQGITGANDVHQPNTLWVKVGQSATINCSHTKDATHNQMYWYRQYHGESMELIVVNFNKSKFSAIKSVSESGSFTVNDVNYNDSAVYFCSLCSVIQNPTDLIKKQDEFAEIKCAHTVNNYDRILWYKHNQDTGFQFMGYIFNESPNPEADFKSKVKFSGDGRNNGSLTINSVSVNDSAVYFCAAYYTVL
ncbi:hypothetical protein Q7C36_011877 [Tachysurus vachellii]|uniref:Ig-like domain-containing protein n=1 Tax=Tachysurus vachellii TaxID=175792 RepID=A0AA88SPL2_TACVA|nr:hypothetical protein Q7C36_011877 [Tachysurus vachellii]